MAVQAISVAVVFNTQSGLKLSNCCRQYGHCFRKIFITFQTHETEKTFIHPCSQIIFYFLTYGKRKSCPRTDIPAHRAPCQFSDHGSRPHKFCPGSDAANKPPTRHPTTSFYLKTYRTLQYIHKNRCPSFFLPLATDSVFLRCNFFWTFNFTSSGSSFKNVSTSSDSLLSNNQPIFLRALSSKMFFCLLCAKIRTQRLSCITAFV